MSPLATFRRARGGTVPCEIRPDFAWSCQWLPPEILGFPLRTLIVDDFKAWRQYICLVLKTCRELQVVGEAADALQAIQKTEELNPDLILLDIGLPNLSGIEVANRLCSLLPRAKILFLTQENDADIARKVLKDGAQGYVLKTDAGRELLPAVQAIVREICQQRN